MTTKTRFSSVLALVFTLGGMGCSAEVDDLGDGDDSFRIINGDPASSNVAEYAATVGIHVRSGNQVSVEPFCTGTLISSEVVMTAAHCCDEANGGPNANPMEPDEIAVYFGEGPAFQGNNVNGEFYGLSEVDVHPSFSRQSLNNDICLLRLDVPNTDTTPIPHLPASLGLSNNDSGTLLDHVGFGYADLGFTQYGIKLHADVPLAGLGCVVPGCPFPATTGQFSYVQNGNPFFGPCNGDSGGPAFINRGGTVYTAGITSYGDQGCSVYGVSTNVSAYQGFIDDFVGNPPPPPPDCSADGVCNGDCAPGDDPDCGGNGGGCDNDGVCENGESCDGRNGTDACGDCPGVTNGRPSNRFCFVNGACEGPGC